MSLKRIAAVAMLAAATAAPSVADGLTPGSVLVFPFHRSSFTQANGVFFTVIAVTNTNLVPISPLNGLGGSTNVHYQYVNVTPDPLNPDFPLDCSISDRVEFLSPADIRPILTSCDNGTAEAEGYLVVSAVDPNTVADPWSHNYLIGSELIIDAGGAVWYLNAIPFSSPQAAGAPTDLDFDGQLDFDGIEYEGIPDELYIDSFVADLGSKLVLANFSGGTAFTANIRFDVFNDNEQALSATYAFRCWIEKPLVDISAVFSAQHLFQNTQHDPAEFDLNCDGVGDLETGWARIRGINHASSVETCPDVALVGALGQALVPKFGGRRLWESKQKQLDGDFFKTATDDPECGVVPNAPPVCDAGPTFTVDVNDVVMFDATGSIDPEGGALKFDWDFGDGTTAPNAGPTPSHAYTSPGVFNVTVTVTDPAGKSSTCGTTVTVNDPNQAPVCDAGPTVQEIVNASVTFDGSGSFDPNGDPLTFDWDFGDGSSALNAGPMPSHTYTMPGVFTVTLTVSDGTFTVMCDTTATILNVVPVCNIVTNPPAGPGGAITPILFQQVAFDASTSFDPDGGAIVSFMWDFGDGATATGPMVSHAFTSENPFTVTLTVTDDEGSSSSCTLLVLPNG
jgi:PKD repeat protein